MSDQDPNANVESGHGGGSAEMPWTDPSMPCVYCGQPIARQSDRCPQCKTSYSFAVRRASREIEGPWFYIEPRNLSNRGVDFQTMLKLIEKGRLRRNSVVRGPSTHQDWVFAAEAPLLSKHLGVCPHCFGPAAAEQEFCDSCDRSLDERPGRLRPGLTAAKAVGHFRERDVLEEKLAAALAPHDLAVAASTVVTRQEEPSALDEILAREKSESRVTPASRRDHVGEEGRRRAKPLVVLVLTLVTVIPLGLLMLYLPLGLVLPGNVDTPGTVAYNVHHNQLAVREAIFGRGQDARDQAEEPQARTLMSQGDAAVAAAKYDLAISSYEKVIAAYSGTMSEKEARVKLDAAKTHIGERQQQRRAELLERYHRVEDALKGGRDEEARRLLAAFTQDERVELKAAGTDVGNLDDRLAATELKKRDEGLRQRQRDEVKGLLDKGRQQMDAQQYSAAQATFESIANKYPADYLPAGVKLADLIAEARGKVPSTAVAPPKDPEAVKAQSAWDEVKRLEGQRQFDEAIKKCQELQALPAKYQPQGLAEKIDTLKTKAVEKRKADFFGTK